MNCKLLKFFGIVIMLLFNSISFAQKSENAAADSSATSAEQDSLKNDDDNVADTIITQAVFDSANDSIIKWKQVRDFGYMVYLDSLLRKKKGLRVDTVSIDKGDVNRRSRIIQATSSNSDGFLNSFPVKIFFWMVAVFFIGFILYKLFFTGALFAGRNVKAGDEPANKEPETLNEYSQYNALIHEAELKNDFNLSIRYLYLQSLKKLADSELIIFSPDKTNNLYVQELSGHSYRDEFAFLTLNYEYVWYGRFSIDQGRYQKLKEKFILFQKKYSTP